MASRATLPALRFDVTGTCSRARIGQAAKQLCNRLLRKLVRSAENKEGASALCEGIEGAPECAWKAQRYGCASATRPAVCRHRITIEKAAAEGICDRSPDRARAVWRTHLHGRRH